MGFIGGEENIGGGAGFDLPGKGAGGGEIEDDFVGGSFFVIGGDFFRESVRLAAAKTVTLAARRGSAEAANTERTMRKPILFFIGRW